MRNHASAFAAMDFLVVPTVTGRLLYILIVMTHERRKVVHFNVTESPTAEWTAQQVVNAFPYDTAPTYLLRDRDSIYGSAFVRRVDRTLSSRSSSRRERPGKVPTSSD